MSDWAHLRRAIRRLFRRTPPPPPDAALVLRRPGAPLGLLRRAWIVEMDGARLTKLRAGGTRRIEVRSGRHKLNLWAGDEGSLPLTLTLARGETAEVDAMTMARAIRLGLVEGPFAPDPLLLRRVR